MSEKRETILRLTQDATGKITDVKIEQEPKPVPEYVLEIDTSPMQTHKEHPYPDQTITEASTLFVMSGRSYKRVGEEEIPVPVASSTGEVEMSGNDGSFLVRFHFDTQSRETADEPGSYTFVPEVHQTEEGGKRESMRLACEIPPAVFPEEREVKTGYAETQEQTVAIRVRHMPEPAYRILVDKEKTSPWIHAKGDMSKVLFTCDRNLSPKPRSGEIVFAVDSPTPIEGGSRHISVTQELANVMFMFNTTDVTDEGLSGDKTRRLVRLKLTIIMRDQVSREIINPDVPWRVTGSDERVVVESVDAAKRELLLSLDVAETLEPPVAVTIRIEDGSDMTMEIPLFKEDLTPSEK